MNCPICNKEIKPKHYSDEIWGMSTTVEGDYSCPRCDYRDHDAYGAHEVSFGKYRWGWYYSTPREEKDEIQREIDAAIKISRPSFSNRMFRYYTHYFDSPF